MPDIGSDCVSFLRADVECNGFHVDLGYSFFKVEDCAAACVKAATEAGQTCEYIDFGKGEVGKNEAPGRCWWEKSCGGFNSNLKYDVYQLDGECIANAASDPCLDVDCGENGACVDGACDCGEGYSGDACEITSGYLSLGPRQCVDVDGVLFDYVLVGEIDSLKLYAKMEDVTTANCEDICDKWDDCLGYAYDLSSPNGYVHRCIFYFEDIPVSMFSIANNLNIWYGNIDDYGYEYTPTGDIVGADGVTEYQCYRKEPEPETEAPTEPSLETEIR